MARPPIELTAQLQELVVGALKAGNYLKLQPLLLAFIPTHCVNG